jgi:ribose transport system substrate-binding protein
MVTGVAGTSVDTDRNKGVESVLKKYPGIKITAHYSGNWDSAAAQRATAAQLPSLPQVDGVWVSGGTDGVVKAFIDAGKTVPVVAGEGENGYRRYSAAGYNGHHDGHRKTGAADPVGGIVLLAFLGRGRRPERSYRETVKNGLTAFPKLPDSFFADFTDSGPKATVVICVQAALTGKPCPGTLNIRLP